MPLNKHLIRVVLTCVGNFATSNVAIAHTAQENHTPPPDAIQANLNLDRSAIQSIDIPIARDGAMVIDVELAGAAVELQLAPVSVRADDFAVYINDGAGELREIAPPAETNYRGTVRQWPGSDVAATITSDGLKAYIVDDLLGTFGIQPARDVDTRAAADAHVVYNMNDVTPLPVSCGLVVEAPAENNEGEPQTARAGVICNYIAEIAFDADYEFYQLNSSSVTATVADIESIVNGMNVIYNRDVDITHLITRIIVQTSNNDGYNSTSPNSLLVEFRNKWNDEHRPGGGDFVQRDVAHLMTGKDLDGSVIGIAYLGVICGNSSSGNGYGLSQSRFTTNYGLRVSLTAHEVGHNWNANHCNDTPDCGVMCSGIGGCSGQYSNFGSSARADIIPFRNTRSCITNGSPANDCNANCIDDALDIAGGFSSDCNGNQVPDECDTCRADFDGTGKIDVSDLFVLLADWGSCPASDACSCLSDLNDDHVVNVSDLFDLLGTWGTCN